MMFEMTHKFFKDLETFTEETAPLWLSKSKDYEWFWRDRVLTLPVGGTVDTDFQTIRRIA